jgi:hypothetical protein
VSEFSRKVAKAQRTAVSFFLCALAPLREPIEHSEPMIVPTSAKVGIAVFFNNTKARLQKCNRAFLIVEQLSSTVPALRLVVPKRQFSGWDEQSTGVLESCIWPVAIS